MSSGYQLWAKDERAKVAQEGKKLNSKELGKRWKRLSDSDRIGWKLIASPTPLPLRPAQLEDFLDLEARHNTRFTTCLE